MRERRHAETALAVVALALILMSSCSGPVVTAVGDSNDIVVIHSEEGDALVGPIVAILETPNPWLLDEPHFATTLTTPGGSKELRNIRHVLLVGTWAQRDLADLARRAFPRLDSSDPVALRLTEDVWAKGQLVAAVMGPTEQDVLDYLGERGPGIAEDLADAAVLTLAGRLRSDAEAAGMTEALEDRFGWSIAPPTGYDFFTTHAAEGFVFFRRTRPDRTIFVSWEEGGSDRVTQDYALERREQLALRYFDGDVTEQQRPLLLDQVDFVDRSAVRVSGWWGNRELVGGGPFRSYCFHEPSQNRVYLLDASLFAPGFDKTALVRNLDAIAHTFSTPSDAGR